MSSSARCAGCRYLRRRCTEDCVLAPYFPSTHPERFACVHKIFGASNITRMLQHIPVEKRATAADSIAYEAYWRVRDPIYGCVGIISQLQQEIEDGERVLAKTRAQVAMVAAQGDSSWRLLQGEEARVAGMSDAYQLQVDSLFASDQQQLGTELHQHPPPHLELRQRDPS